MPNWRQRRKEKKKARNTGKLNSQDVVNNANNDLNVLDNAKSISKSGYTSAAHSDRVKAAIKEETTGQSTISTKPGYSTVESSTPTRGGVSTGIIFNPTSSSNQPTTPTTPTKTSDPSYYGGVSQKRKFLPGYKSVKSESAEAHYTGEQSSGKIPGAVPIGHGTLTKKQKRTVKSSAKEVKRRAKRDVKQKARFIKYTENQ